jgi:DNA-binding NarL/FixJ family response regulator
MEQALAARSAFEQLGAALAAQEADKVAARLGGRRASARSIGMTAREIEVLSLVARGLPNREIAERLVVSEHTVHRHLANIYARLGVSSRAAAVALASERDLLD